MKEWGKRVYPAIVVVLLAVHALWIKHYYFLTDDAFISFRYSKNLALGRGLVWNAGERVEGYTNFLWTLLLAAGYRVGAAPSFLSIFLSISFTAATLFVLFLLVRRLFAERGPSIFLLVLLFLVWNRSWNVWATSGLETRMATFFVVTAIYALGLFEDRRHLLLGSLFFGLAVLTRPDALLMFALFVPVRLLGEWDWKERDFALLIRRAVPMVLPFGIIVGSHFLFRFLYYGALLPNTYYAKIDAPWPSMGMRFFILFLLEYGLLALLPFAVIILVLHRREEKRTVRFYLQIFFSLVPVPLYYCYKAGGDMFEYRIFDPLLPFLAILVSHAMWIFWMRWKKERNSGGGTGRGKSALSFAARAVLTLWLAVLSLFIQHWKLFLPNAKELMFFGAPENSPDEIMGAYRLIPGLNWSFNRWIHNYKRLHYHQIAVRRSEHAHFWEERIREFQMFQGVAFPPDAVMEDGGIGIVGYYVDATLIDRLGLTDRVVARNVWQTDPAKRLHAHNRIPPPGYLEKRGVNFYPVCVAESRDIDQEWLEKHCPMYRDGAKTNLYVGLYDDRYIVVQSDKPGWVESRFRQVRRVD